LGGPQSWSGCFEEKNVILSADQHFL